MNKFSTIITLVAVSVLIAGCAQEKTISTGEQAQEYLELLISKDYTDIQPDQWGIYILEEEQGTGLPWNSELPYSNLRSTIRSIDGTILSTTEADVYKQLDQDSYKPYYYYGPKYQYTAEGSGYAGVEYLLEGMKIGGRRKAIIPSWLITTSRYSTKQEYIDACTVSTHLIYDITLDGQCKDVQQNEIDLLRAYVTANYGADQKSCTYKSDQTEGTFYFISDTTAFNEDSKRTDDAAIYLKYTGRRLDGQAFDTNDQATAIKENLFVKGKTYGSSAIKFSSDYTSITMDGSSSLIDGFKGALYKMHWAGQKATVLFVSDLGYGSSGSGDAIPPYASLIFELELEGE
jgi:FKBP-type peptidyl-prolyl cis-trans isomerase